MSTFAETRVAITRTGTLSGVTVEFTTIDGSNEVSGHFKDANEQNVGSFGFSQSNKSLNIYAEDVSGVDFESILTLLSNVNTFIISQSE